MQRFTIFTSNTPKATATPEPANAQWDVRYDGAGRQSDILSCARQLEQFFTFVRVFRSHGTVIGRMIYQTEGR